jgi:hypothetical protein
MRLIPRGRAALVRLGALGAAVALVAGGVAYAAGASPFVGPRGNINSCLPPNGGTVHVWKPDHGCTGGWLALSWASAGATGATGQTGATGPTNPSALTLDGQALTKVMVRIPTPGTGSSSDAVFDADGLTISTQCAAGGDASIGATGPSSADSELTVSGYDSSGAFGSQTSALGALNSVALGPSGAGESTFSYASSSGQLVNGQLGWQSAGAFGGYAGCAFFGDVTSG